MRCIALINQKGGVGKTTVTANLGAALALAGKRVVVVDLDPQANLTLYLGLELAPGVASSYRVLTGEVGFGAALRASNTPGLRILPTDIHLSGAEQELSTTEGRESLLRVALQRWREEHAAQLPGEEPADYVLFDCPPSLGLLSLNALAAADEVFLVVQTQFLALQGMSKLVEVIELVKKRLHPGLELTGIVPCMYDSRMRLAREVLSELRRYFPEQVFRTPINSNVKLAESPSFGQTIFEYAPDSIGARDFATLCHEVLARAALRTPEVPLEEAAPPPKPRKRSPLVPLPPPPIVQAAPPPARPAVEDERSSKPPARKAPGRVSDRPALEKGEMPAAGENPPTVTSAAPSGDSISRRRLARPGSP